jgi:hypothetical protein
MVGNAYNQVVCHQAENKLLSPSQEFNLYDEPHYCPSAKKGGKEDSTW